MFQGIYTALITPFKNGNGIDEDLLNQLIERQVEAGIHGIILGGSTGEGQTLSLQEKKNLLRMGAQFRDKIKIIGGCGSSSTYETLEHLKLISDSGAHGALVSAPPYNKPPQRGLIKHFETLCATVNFPIIVYNVPGRTAVNIQPATMKTLFEIPQVQSLKEASGNWDQILQMKAITPAGKTILSGDDSLNLSFLAIGAHGTVSVLSNVAPRAMISFWNAWQNQQVEKARSIFEILTPLAQNLFLESNPIPAKWCLSCLLKTDFPLRSPLVTLDGLHQNKLKEDLEKLKLKELL